MSYPSKQQRLAEWESLDDAGRNYHLQQWKEVKRSTVTFSEFVNAAISGSKSVLDMGCGAGSATAYIAKQHPRSDFIGIDLSPELVNMACELTKAEKIPNLSFAVDDWFDLRSHKDVDGVISMQTLSWLPEFEEPLRQVFQKISPRWIALSSLFYEGDISCKIQVEEHIIGKKCAYNIYALPAVVRFARDFGYRMDCAKPFNIDIDLPMPADRNVMGTYTVKVEPNQLRLQISGPLLMSWYFVMLQKQES